MDNPPIDPNQDRLRLFAERLQSRHKFAQHIFLPKNLAHMAQLYRAKREANSDKTIEQFFDELLENVETRLKKLQNLTLGTSMREEAFVSKILKSFEKDNFKSVDAFINSLALKRNIEVFIDCLPKDPDELSKRTKEGLRALTENPAKLEIIKKAIQVLDFGRHDPSDFTCFDEAEEKQSRPSADENAGQYLPKRVKSSNKDHEAFKEFLENMRGTVLGLEEIQFELFDNFCEILLSRPALKYFAKLKVDLLNQKIFFENSNNPILEDVIINSISLNHGVKENLLAIANAWKKM